MDKVKILEILDKIPQDLIESAYDISFTSDTVRIQMNYSSKIVGDYVAGKDSFTTIRPTGYFEWRYQTDDIEIPVNIVMT